MNNNNRGHERRQGPRRTADFKTTLVCNNVPVVNCKTRNIGFGGMYINTPGTPPAAGSSVSIILDIPGRSPVSLHGIVQHSESRGLGVTFQGLTSQSYATLVDVVYAKPAFQPGSSPAAFRVANG